jgi:hypothetical protein
VVKARGVLRIRAPQLGALARIAAGDDITPFVAQAREHHPALAAELGATLPAHVARIRDLAFAHGLRRRADIHRFVDLGLTMGLPWLQAQHDMIAAQLADPRIADPSRRLDALFEHVLLALEEDG